jgi:hypothetical protein
MGFSLNARFASGLSTSLFGKIGISVFFWVFPAVGLISAAFIGASFLETLATYGHTVLLAAKTYGSVFYDKVDPRDSTGKMVGSIRNHVAMVQWGDASQVFNGNGHETS